jgi:hypothetical protein
MPTQMNTSTEDRNPSCKTCTSTGGSLSALTAVELHQLFATVTPCHACLRSCLHCHLLQAIVLCLHSHVVCYAGLHFATSTTIKRTSTLPKKLNKQMLADVQRCTAIGAHCGQPAPVHLFWSTHQHHPTLTYQLYSLLPSIPTSCRHAMHCTCYSGQHPALNETDTSSSTPTMGLHIKCQA